MNTKIILFTIPRSGSTYVASSIIKNFYQQNHNYKHVTSEILNSLLWRDPFYQETLKQVTDQIKIDYTDNSFYNRPNKDIFLQLLNQNIFLYKYFPDFEKVIGINELIANIKDKDIAAIFLYRKSILNNLVSQIYLQNTKSYVLYKDDVIDRKNVNEFKFDINLIYHTLNNYNQLYKQYKLLVQEGLINKIYSYEDLTFDPVNDFDIHIDTPTQKIILKSEKDEIIKNYDLVNLLSKCIKTYNFPYDDNLNFTPEQ